MATTLTFPDRGSKGTSNNTDHTLAKDATQTSQTEVYDVDEETLSHLLSTKMKCALADAGYDEVAQAIVSKRVEENIISCGVALDEQSARGNLLGSDLVQSQLKDLMSGECRINSNEVVLLILMDENTQIPWSAAQAIRDASCAILRDAFHIFPVRVYVAYQPDDKKKKAGPRTGFCLALLNVVNTDIGGPGMVQLLDSWIPCPDWERMIVSAEAWNRTQLLWRHEEQHKFANHNEQLPEHHNAPDSGASHFQPAVDKHGIAPAESAGTKPVDDVVGEVLGDSRRTSVSDSPAVLEHPAMTELRAWEASRSGVQHPTWEHSHGGDSLIDLIRMQASRIPESDIDGDNVDVEIEDKLDQAK